MRQFENYHVHSDETNIFFTDSPVKKRDYAVRAVELGHHTLSSCEHGFAGNFLNTYDIACANGLKFVFAAELYWVKDRSEKDRTNCHIIVMARNESGRRQINRLISEANDTGFYNRPRVDIPLLLTLNPADVVVTTACIAFYGYGMQESEQVILQLRKHFGDSLYIEVQAHPIERQKEINRMALRLYRKEGIRLIAACYSNYIRPEQAQERQDMQYGIFTEADEDGEGTIYMDYPDGDELFSRFVDQGVLPEAVIEEAIRNTLIVRTFEDFSFDKTRKIPNPYPNLTREERDALYLKLVNEAWEAYRQHIPEDRWPQYEEAIRYETDTVVGGGIADYFLLDRRIVERGVEKGGIITQSGRGSGPSFFTNSLLGFSSMDRIALPVTMFPDRFVSKPRLVAGQLPDLDLNVADRTPFVEAQKEILGEEHAYPMIAYGTMKKKAAWKMYCRAVNKGAEVISQQAMQEISDALGRYDAACKEADEDEEIDLSEYVPAKYMDLYRRSESYGGIISGKTVHPCAILIYDGNIREEIGLVRAKSRSGKNDELVTVIDGVTADRYGYVKNDLLRVAVWELIDAIYRNIGIPIPSTNELLSWVTDDEATWKVFEKGWCCGVNQCEKPKTKARLMRYAPKNLTELSAFVAAIRPGFKSNLELFLSRQHFDYGIPEFDKLIQTKEMKNSFLLYQENIMSALQYAGFPPTESYAVLKHIAKKHPDKIAEIKPLFIEGFSAKVGSETAEMVWQIINDASSYSFNASHSTAVAFDALYVAWAKAHHPLETYHAMLQVYSRKTSDKERLVLIEGEMLPAYGVRIASARWGDNNTDYIIDRDDNTISDALYGIPYMNRKVADELSHAPNVQTFADALVWLHEQTSVNARQIMILIRLGYFERFGSIGKLKQVFEAFNDGAIKYRKTYVDKTKQARLTALRELEQSIDVPENPYELASNQVAILGHPQGTFSVDPEDYVVTEVNPNYSPRIYLYSLARGTSGMLKMAKGFYNTSPLKPGDCVRIRRMGWETRAKVVWVDGQKQKVPGVTERWITRYEALYIAPEEKEQSA